MNTREAMSIVQGMIEWRIQHRTSMERAYPSEPKSKLEERRWAGRSDRRELRALCVALRTLRSSEVAS